MSLSDSEPERDQTVPGYTQGLDRGMQTLTVQDGPPVSPYPATPVSTPIIPVMGGLLGRVTRFTGKENVVRFTREFETRAKAEAWTPEQQAAILRCACSGPAAAFLEAEDDDADYETLKRKLHERFHYKISQQEAYSRLCSIKQGNSKISEYALRVEEAAAELGEVVSEFRSTASRANIVISSFVDGLHPELRKMLILHEFKTLSDCIGMALRAESVLRATPTQSKKSIHSVESPKTSSTNGARKPKWKGRPNSGTGPHKPESVICFHCQEQGHFKPDCPYAHESVEEARAHRDAKN